jgi:uncharacterized hydrophobic protein (TIGR00271 family)
MQSRGTLAALLGPDLDVAPQLQWAVHLAEVRKLDLLILQRVESQDEQVVEIALNQPPKGAAAHVIQKVRRLIEESPTAQAGPWDEAKDPKEVSGPAPHVVHVRLKLVHFTSLPALRRSVLRELEHERIDLFTLARRQLSDMSDNELVEERRLFIRYIPCEMVLCHGAEPGKAIPRVLTTAAPGSNAAAAVKLGVDLAHAGNGSVTAVHVNPDVGALAERVGERRLDRLLKKALETDDPAVRRRVIIDNQPSRGIRRVWEEGEHDLIVVGASRSQLEGSMGTRLGKGVPVVIVSAASPIVNTLRRFVEEGVGRFVPQIEREDRVALVDRLQSSAAWNFDFLALMVLSTSMAAIGLMQNSAAVVIGAMLVAPLMTPLLGLGLALQQGNPVLARLSLRSIAFGILVSLLGGFAVGFLTPSFVEPTREMLSRGGPGLLDLVVAFAAGLAAAYASSRPSLIAALPGVAIAASLVPPIATSGLALSLGDFSLAIGALLLFGINMVTIVLASMTSLWAVGFRQAKRRSRWTVWSGTAVIVAVMSLVLYLSLKSQEEELTEQFPAGLVGAVEESLGTRYRLDSLAVAYDEIGLQLNVRVAGRTPAPEELATEVRGIASDHYEKPVRVRLLTLIELDTDPEE